MADIDTDKRDEQTIADVVRHGLGDSTPDRNKWKVLRIALAKSLQISTPPDESYDDIDVSVKGPGYKVTRVTGAGLPFDELGRQDFDYGIRALLSAYHGENLCQSENADKNYKKYLQRHVRRGLHEIRTTWLVGHDFHNFLYHELFASTAPRPPAPSRGKELLGGLKEIGVAAQIRGVEEGPRISRFRVYLDDVNHLDKVKRGLDKLGLYLGLQRQGIFFQDDNEPRIIALDVPRATDTWRTVPGARIKEWASQAEDSKPLSMWAGVDALGLPYHFDLAKAPHLLAGGTTGSGKSVCLHALLLSLLWRLSPDKLQLCLIDPKKVELSLYEGLPHLVDNKIFIEIESILETLEWLVEEMERRTNLLKEAGIANLQEGHASGRLDLPYLVLVVEELADLMFQSKETETPLVRLAQKARATGIHMILATQRPDSATFSGLLRTSIPARIALSVRTSSDSKIILDEPGAEKLSGSGDMLVRPFAGAHAMRVHGAKVNKDDIQACIRAAQGK